MNLAHGAHAWPLTAIGVLLITGAPASLLQGQATSAAVVSTTAIAPRPTVRPGDQFPIAVILRHASGFHTWPRSPTVPDALVGLLPIATSIDVILAPAGTALGTMQWPPETNVTVNYTGTTVEIPSYVDTAIAFVPVSLPTGLSPKSIDFALAVHYQACNERICLFPATDTVRLSLIVASPQTIIDVAPASAGMFSTFDYGAFRSMNTKRVEGWAGAIPIRFLGWTLTMNPTGRAGFALLLTLAAVGGALLNFTPCVLPILPIKVLSLAGAAGSPGHLRLLGAALSLGVVGFWIVLGAAIAFVAGFTSISGLFATGWFAPLVGVVIGVMAVSAILDPAVRLPPFVARIAPDGAQPTGAFALGIMTAVLSTPCTAPFMGAAAAWAATQSPEVTLATFGAIGIGMALPYMILTSRPALLGRLPRTGPAAALVKQIMGVLLLGVAAFYVGSSGALPRSVLPAGGFWWIVAAFVLAAIVWGVRGVFQITPALRARTLAVVLAAVIALPTILSASVLSRRSPVRWTSYTPDRLSAAAARDEVVVIDFTADWCINCKALEIAVLNRPRIVSLLSARRVLPLRVDLTQDNPAGRAMLAELGWVGIPLLAVFGPGTGYQRPLTFDSYTVAVVEAAILQARRPTTASPRTGSP